MEGKCQLPFKDHRGYCNIFFSAIGGDGANMAAKMLFKIGVSALGLDGGYDAKYGSEKKGTPTDVSVRFCDLGRPVRFAGPSNTYNVLVAFREGLIRLLRLNKGLAENAMVVVNSTKSPDELRDVIQLHSGTVIAIDASRIAVETRSRLNMPMLALVCEALGFPREVVRDKIVGQWPAAVKENVGAFEAALGHSVKRTFTADGKFAVVPPSIERPAIGYLNMPPGGAMQARFCLTSYKDNAKTSSGLVPVFDAEACTACALCTTVCADPGALVWNTELNRLGGVDTTFCKGCMRCVPICPQGKKGKALRYPAELEVTA